MDENIIDKVRAASWAMDRGTNAIGFTANVSE